jgi:hypothetical protein
MAGQKEAITAVRTYGSGLALILIFLITFILTGEIFLLYISLGVTVLLMVWPAPFRYWGRLWFSLGEILGLVVSRILLSIIYLLLVIPVGLIVGKKIRRNMQLFSFKNGSDSVFKERDHFFSPADLEKPF